ncbi:hypothetical protein FEM48_Zijuj01G0217200 [Ziziphus jujuba var. spinosa]|uniref:Apple domain-containing protein n=1 Tax=Ziziphus jujuba var. spinosa TaxID=714518 RepID=A0A978W3Q5_ZIZJJ|nr:hypothetical protein FEM48_Zijuj01G0217200 [Ziziphus jujuba var. spinosa]
MMNTIGHAVLLAQKSSVVWDRYAWSSVTQSWDVFSSVPRDNGDRINHSATRTNIHQGLSNFKGLKLLDATFTWVYGSLSLKECRAECLDNCSCTAFTNSDIKGKGSGCVMWFGDLIDIREIKDGQDIYIRMHVLELGQGKA